ncbi:L,D-transpeptidase family protein [Daejeonella oryzae]|uniref:L,D-transpeptidase family protein n=1 Tax=Daejeonella oryzae TaxID=1122943 RepID=UPI00040B3E13|nr:L,D-transpeptidase family protein [Daejeonella oryzae]
MKHKKIKNILLLLTTFFWSIAAVAQMTPDDLHKIISENSFNNETEIKEFYSRLNYTNAWIKKGNTLNLGILISSLKKSAENGLREKDYHFDFIQSFLNRKVSLQTKEDSLKAEIRLTDAAIHYYSDMVYGNTIPVLGFNGLGYKPNCFNISTVLADHILKNNLQEIMLQFAPASTEITIIQSKIKWYLAIINQDNFKEIIVRSREVNETNTNLIFKLYQLGLLDTAASKLSPRIVRKSLQEAQLQFNLPENTVLDDAILKELNVPLAWRLKQLDLSLNYYRWLNCIQQNQSVIVVNIPAAYLKVYKNNKVILEMRMVVGKPATPTPTLISRVNEVILYPYWHVPKSIAIKELLPSIKRDPSYLDKNNYQVLNKAGKIMNPYSINWRALSMRYFPYIIRQCTGCDNALGLIKLNFNNPYSVYLHDTPAKTLFKKDSRFFSHGCMRMEKPMDLAHLILKNNSVAIDTVNQKGCVRNQSPISVLADEKMPVLVWYNPAGIDSSGRLLFFEDIYRKFNWAKRE